MEKKLPIVDADGRLWTWKAATGYMPSGIPQDIYRKEFLQGCRKNAPKKKPPKKSQEAIEALFTSTVTPVAKRKARLAPQARREQERAYPRNCRQRNRHVFGREGSGERVKRDMREILNLKALLFEAQDGLCAICGKAMGHTQSLDHTIPLALGGPDRLGNYVLAHQKCNEEKSNDTPTGCEMVWLLMVNAKIGALPILY